MSSQRNLFYSNLWQWLRQNVIPISCRNCRNIGRSEQKSVRVRIEMDSEFMSSLALDHTQQREMSNENLISNLLFCIKREPWCSDPGRGWINWIRNKNQMNDNKERMNAATDEGCLFNSQMACGRDASSRGSYRLRRENGTASRHS